MLLAFFLLARLALADEIVDPTIAWEAPAVYPEAARAEGGEVVVRLTLALDATGRVLAAEAEEGSDPRFVEAAITTARSSRFTPAMLDGRPVPATITYALRFTLDVQPVLSMEGRVLEAGIREPLEGVTLELTGPDGAVAYASTDAEGRFTLYDLAPGPWTVTGSGPGLTPESADLTLTEGQVGQVSLWLVRSRTWEGDAVEELTVIGRLGRAEVTERVLAADEARVLPGSNGDVIKAIQNLPGVARPPAGIGQLIIRGTRPEDSGFYLDGARIPLVFHFAGLSTVIDSRALSEIAFLSGNYGVRYGDTLGGVVDLRTDPAVPERSSGRVAIDVFQARAFVEQRVSDRTAITAAVGRSYADAILTPLLSKAEGFSFRAPRYWDATARVLHRSANLGTFDALVLFSDDRFRIVGGEDGGTLIGLSTTFLKTRFVWRVRTGDRWSVETVLGTGPDEQRFTFRDEDESYDRHFMTTLRHEWLRDLPEGDGLGWRLGLDLKADAFGFRFGPLGNAEEETGDGFALRPAFYAEATVREGPVTVSPGVRLSSLALADQAPVALDPRASVTVEASPTTELVATLGRYSQYPQYRELLAVDGLRPAWSLQSSVGVRQRFRYGLSVQVTGFYNELFDLVSGREGRFEFFSGPPPPPPYDTDDYANDGRGRIYGGELLFKASGKRGVAWLSTTVSRSDRVSRPGDDREPFRFDQTLILNALGSAVLPKRWRVGGRVRVGTGNPYTPVANRFQELDGHTFIPVFAEGEVARVPPFWSIDLRVDKDWVFRQWTFTAYLDVQNVTSNRNPEVMGWTYDYSEQDPLRGLPILPAFGLEGSW